MKKVINKKLSGPSKFVGKVFQRQRTGDVDSRNIQMTQDPSNLFQEVESLKEQIDNLKTTLNSLKIDTENKEVKLANLAREKEKLSINLAKVRRSNEALSRQLEDERSFYYKEKETYCQEMNDFKKLKKVLSNTEVGSSIDSTKEIEKLKKTLEHTLQTNYNLSVKFLRMRETKNLLSRTLNKTEEDHRRVVDDLKTKIEHLKEELQEVLNQKFDAPLSPSNKKYLQLVNRNSSLVYENLQLQIQVDHLNLQIKRNRIQKTKSETSAQIQHPNKEKRIKIKTSTKGEDNRVIKIYEKDERIDIPTLTILSEKDRSLKPRSSERKLQLPVVNESKLEVFQVSGVPSRSSTSDLSGVRKRSRSAPKVVQSVTFKDSTPPTKRDEAT